MLDQIHHIETSHYPWLGAGHPAVVGRVDVALELHRVARIPGDLVLGVLMFRQNKRQLLPVCMTLERDPTCRAGAYSLMERGRNIIIINADTSIVAVVAGHRAGHPHDTGILYLAESLYCWNNDVNWSSGLLNFREYFHKCPHDVVPFQVWDTSSCSVS